MCTITEDKEATVLEGQTLSTERKFVSGFPTIWVSTVLKLTSRKTEIARSARGPTSQGLRAEDALAESYLVQKILVT